MEVYLMNKNFERYAIIQDANSIIWHRKYYEPGDFEIYTIATPQNIANYEIGNYVVRDDDDAVGIIENITVNFDETNEIDMMTITGRFTESLYERRIVWSQTNISSKSVSTILRTLIYQNCISPTDELRKMSALCLPAADEYEQFNQTETLNVQYTGDNLLTVIQDMCKKYGLGFKNVRKDNQFCFMVYQGVDRSYAQTENTYIVFSDEYGNLMKSEYTKVTSNLKNVALVAGEGEGTQRKTATVASTYEYIPADLERREVFVDQRNLSSEEGSIKNEEYQKMLTESGKDSLSQFVISEVFTGETRLDDRYIYKVDVDLGDICVIENTDWGLALNSRIVGVIETEDENGYNIIFEFGS